MSIPPLRNFTPARVDLGRAGHSLRTADFLALQLAHARAHDAVHTTLNAAGLASDLSSGERHPVIAHSAAADRGTYLSRPDLGRRLTMDSRRMLTDLRAGFDVAFVIADGLSAIAVERHALPLLNLVYARLAGGNWNIAPVVIVEQGRVAIGDEIGECLGASQTVMLIGERPGLSSPASLGIYLTWHPGAGLTDADRNCISNIHEQGLRDEEAANKLIFLMTEARRRKLSGVELKEDARMLTEAAGVDIRRPVLPGDWETIRLLLGEYGRHLADSLDPADFSSFSFEQEIALLPSPYKVLLLASVTTGEGGEKPAGCLFLKEIPPEKVEGTPDERACEVKRLWVRPEFRRLGIGKRLTEKMITEASSLGYTAMYLDTVPRAMGAAADMYRKLNFRSVERYNDNPISGVAFFRRPL